MRMNERSAAVALAIAILAGIALPPGATRATIVSTNYSISEIPTGSVPTSGLAVVGDAVFFGVGAFGGGTQSVVRIDSLGTTTIAAGFNSLAGFAYDAVNNRLIVGDNALEAPGSSTGDNIYAIPDPLGPVVGPVPLAADLAVLVDGDIPGVSDLALDPNDPNTLYVGDADFPSGRIVQVDLDLASSIAVQTGLVKIAAGIAVDDSSLFFGLIEPFPGVGGEVSVVSLPGSGAISILVDGLVGQFDLTFADDGTLLASNSQFAGPSEVVRIDPLTGEILEVVASGFDFATGIAESAGIVYAIEGGFTPLPRILVFTPVPEPGAFLYLGAGLGALSFRRRWVRA